MSLYVLLLAFVLIACAGFFSGLLGLGGGIFIVPMLLFMLPHLGFDMYLIQSAVATSLACVSISGIFSTFKHAQHNTIDWVVVKYWLGAVCIGSLFSVVLLQYLSVYTFKIIYIVIISIVLGYRMFSGNAIAFPYNSLKKEGMILPFFVGIISGMLGIGGGNVVLALTVFGVSVKRAIGCASVLGAGLACVGAVTLMVLGYNVSSTISPYNIGYVNVLAVGMIVPIMMVFVSFGMRVNHRLSHSMLYAFLCIVYGLLILRMVWIL